jgi:hypothetical protein
MISNPLSGRNRRGGLNGIRRLLLEHPTIPHYEVCTPAEARHALDRFAVEDVNLVVVNSGDGTVQAVLTLLFTETCFRSIPLLALLSGGTTNMTHQDLGLPGSGVDALRRLLNWLHHGEGEARVRRRSVLRVQTATCAHPLYGLFFGAACIFKGIHFFHSRVHRAGLSGDPAHLLILARFLWALARRQDALVEPASVAICADRGVGVSHDVLMLLITTLDRLILGVRPFWGSGSGPLRLTVLGARPRGLLRALPALVQGRRIPWAIPSNGYLSCRARDIQLDLHGGFALDGELFETGAGPGSVHIRDGGAADFLRL